MKIRHADIYSNILICLFFVLTFASTYIQINASFGWYGGFAVSFILFVISFLNSNTKIYKEELFFYSLVFVLFFISICYNHNLKLSSLLQYFRYVFVALSLPRIKLNKIITGSLYYLVCLFFVLSMDGFNLPITVVNGVSRNIISIHLLVLLLIYILSSENYLNSFLSIIPSFLGAIISIASYCRSGTFSFLIITIGTFLLLKKPIKEKLLYSIIFLSICYLLFLGEINVLLNNFSTKDPVVNNLRWTFIKSYFSATKESVLNILLGTELTGIGVLSEQMYNPHNSFIAAHAHFGLLYLYMMFALIINAFIKYFKKNRMFFFLLFSICFRAFFDTAAFNGVLDIFFYYFIFENIFIFKYMHSTLFVKDKKEIIL